MHACFPFDLLEICTMPSSESRAHNPLNATLMYPHNVLDSNEASENQIRGDNGAQIFFPIFL